MLCPSCHREVDLPGAGFCPLCGATLPPPPPETPEPTPPAGSSVPFDDTTRPFMERWWSTLLLSFSDPNKLFANLPAENLAPPVVYGVINGTLAGIFGLAWQMVIEGLTGIVAAGDATGFVITLPIMFLLTLFMPLLAAASLFIVAGIFHVCLLLFGSGNRGFGVTMRAVAYGQGPNLLAIVPVCGGLIGGIWSMILIIIGACRGHRSDAWRVILAYMLPFLTCCLLVLGIFLVVFSMGAAASM